MQQQHRQYQQENNQNNNNKKRKQKQKTALSVLALLALWSGFNLFSSSPDNLEEDELKLKLHNAAHGYGNHRSLRADDAGLENEVDGDATVADGNDGNEGKAPSPNQYQHQNYIVPKAALDDMKQVEPTVCSRNSRHLVDVDVANSETHDISISSSSQPSETETTTSTVVVDVLSIGSMTRPEYLNGQTQTWASHPYIRNYWGFTEAEDYASHCDTMDDNTLDAYVQTCRTVGGGSSSSAESNNGGAPTTGWNEQVAEYVTRNYASTHNEERTVPGWICAQRRPGRALGWLQNVYGNRKKKGRGIDVEIPDVLVIVDDDTSLDVEKVKQYMQGRNYPFVGAGCVFRYGGFDLAYGGFGTFLNKAAIEAMTQPINCDEKHLRKFGTYPTRNICLQLNENRIGERAVYQPGDSVFDIFYKYSAQEYFCMHSDWALGYMITYYSGGLMDNFGARTCKNSPCSARSVTCHNQSPRDMDTFTMKHGGYSWGYKFGSVQA